MSKTDKVQQQSRNVVPPRKEYLINGFWYRAGDVLPDDIDSIIELETIDESKEVK